MSFKMCFYSVIMNIYVSPYETKGQITAAARIRERHPNCAVLRTITLYITTEKVLLRTLE